MDSADAHRSYDPDPAKTGIGEQRAYVTPFRMPCSGRACRPENELPDGSLLPAYIFEVILILSPTRSVSCSLPRSAF